MSTTTNEPGKVVLDEYYGPQPPTYAQQSPYGLSKPSDRGVNRYPFYIKWGIKIGTVLLGCLTILMGVLSIIDIFNFSVGCAFSGIILVYFVLSYIFEV